MTDHAAHESAGSPSPSAMVRDRKQAEAVIIDLTERGIARDQVTVRPPGGDGGTSASSRRTGERDMVETESAGKRMGTRAIAGGLIGAVLGLVVAFVLFGPPWENGLAAGLTVAVAIGVGYIAAGVGLLQGGVAQVGESGDEPMRPHETDDVIIEVDVLDEAQARTAREVFTSHGADPIG